MSDLTTRAPTGKPPWPMLLLAGREKAGKSYAAAVASSSDMIGRTLWIGIGEDDPDEYGAIPGADFEIVVHDGTWLGIGKALRAAVNEPQVDGKPTLIVMDSMTRLWELIQDEIQAMANARKKGNSAGDASVSMDLWNLAKRKRWLPILDLLREHTGPTILTARLDLTTVMDDTGRPTKEKDWKVQAEKSLVYDVQAIAQMRAPGDVYLTGVKSLSVNIASDQEEKYDGFTVAGLWNAMGLTPETTGPRHHSEAVHREAVTAEQPPAEPARTRGPGQDAPSSAVAAQQGNQAPPQDDTPPPEEQGGKVAEDELDAYMRAAWDDLGKLGKLWHWATANYPGDPRIQAINARGAGLRAEQSGGTQ